MNLPEGWVIRNLRTYGNTLIPNQLVEDFGIPYLEDLIFRFYGIKIRIKRIQEPPTWDRLKGRMVRVNDVWYKAEVVA